MDDKLTETVERRSDHGTHEQAVKFALEVHDDTLQTYEFLQAWSHGNLDEWPEFYEWLDAQQVAPPSLLPVGKVEVERGLKDALYLAVSTLAFHGRDRGTDRQDSMLDGLEEVARKADPTIRAALAALPLGELGWQPIETAPEGNEDEGPFFDVTWAGEQHDYLPVPARAINCYRERGTVKMQHGYPAITTIFRPQPTHWMLPPALREITPSEK